jgi:hypothetical protein
MARTAAVIDVEKENYLIIGFVGDVDVSVILASAQVKGSEETVNME